MTNQNVVVTSTSPEVKSCINTLIAVAASISANSPVLPSAAVPESLALLGGFLGLPHKNLMKRLEYLEGAKVSAWIDSMRSASPTRVKSTLPASSENQEKSSWIVSIIE